MAHTINGRPIGRVGVVGSGQIGPDIALFFATALAGQEAEVVVTDIAADALERGRARAEQKIAKAREARALSGAAADAALRSLRFTTDDEALRDADLVVEAATENLDVKRRIFARLDAISRPDAILASNSSHIEPTEIFASLPAARRARALVLHYFFPAERNPLVEVVPGADTAPGLADSLLTLYEAMGKVPIHVRERFGFAVNPVFEGLFLAAALAVEDGLGTTKEVDAVARRALGLGVGPFTAMNLTGGNPITHHALGDLGTRFGAWWRSPALLAEAVKRGTPWDVPRRDEVITVPVEREQRIADQVRGACFGIVGQVLDAGIVAPEDLEVAVEVGLAMRPPFGAMNAMGVPQALALVEQYAASHAGFGVARTLTAQAARGEPFAIRHVLRRDLGDVAVITIRRPAVLNALNADVYDQLCQVFTAVRDDPAIVAAVLTGFGTRAFVSGADVQFLARVSSAAEGVATAERTKRPGRLIEQLGKPVICALNGPAIGGGNELAMCCTARIARAGLPMVASQPEVRLGIVPGTGATQRLPRLVGLELAAEMLRTGGGLSGREAMEHGLLYAEVEGDVVQEGVTLARRVARGEVCVPRLNEAPMPDRDTLPAVDIGSYSRAIDSLICRAVLDGCQLPLEEGLRFESDRFGDCCATEDMRIGVAHFLEKGPKTLPTFVHR